MDAKLTLRLDQAVIASAKRYAARRRRSVSRLVEDYLSALTAEDAVILPEEIAPLTRRLSDRPPADLPPEAGPGADEEAYYRHLARKHR